MKDYIFSWVYQESGIKGRTLQSINYFFSPLLFGPSFTYNLCYFVQTSSINIAVNILFVFLFFIILIGYIKNYKKLLINISIIYLLLAYLLHCIIGYGFLNSVLYCSLYSWAFIVLLMSGIKKIKETKRSIANLIIAVLLICLFIINLNWLIRFSEKLKDDVFICNKNFVNHAFITIENDNDAISFILDSHILYRCNDGKIILNDVDVLQQRGDTIAGLLNDGRWFKISIINHLLHINIQGQEYDAENNKFFIFGMGLRKKFILTTDDNINYQLIDYNLKKKVLSNLKLINIDYVNYIAELIDYNDTLITVFENKDGIYIKTPECIIPLDDTTKINIPEFDGLKHRNILRRLFNETLVNITDEGPKPNFIAYNNVWYRDGAIIAKVLEETNNIEQIENWLNNITQIYDMQNGIEEADNLGEVLYLLSLSNNPNKTLINNILDEAKKIKKDGNYIEGITDGEVHPVYQTKWLIYGMKKLGLEYTEYAIPKIYDSYSSVFWLDNDLNNDYIIDVNDRWQYLYYAYLHRNKIKIDFNNLAYPISNEIKPSKANFKNLCIINKNLYTSKIVTPHAWSSSEMFLYLLDLDRGKL